MSSRKAAARPKSKKRRREATAKAAGLAVSEYEALLIAEIAKRARELGDERPAADIEADITTVHTNDCPMRLAELLAANDFDFRHDVDGIARHLDRKTGKLGPFWPRCSRPQEPWDSSQGILH